MNNRSNIESQDKSKIKVIVGMSGGVDSSVAAHLLLQQGYQVEGLFMKNWEEDDTSTQCTAALDAKDAQSVCDRLNIKLHKINFAAEYWDNVFTNFLDEHKKGRTPNPDILCNKEIKFKQALNYAKILGADYFATGHYAKKLTWNFCNQKENDIKSNTLDKKNSINITLPKKTLYALAKPLDENKDQTYFLYTLNQNQLKNVLFPLSELDKSKIRDLAKKNNFITHDKKDSTGICFIGERNFKPFLEKYLKKNPGNIVNVDTGKKLGTHDGLMYYTIGQRQGLGIGGIAGSNNEPWYVVEKDLKTNELRVAQSVEHPKLFAKEFIASQLCWSFDFEDLKAVIKLFNADNNKSNITETTNNLEFKCFAKIRYRQRENPCTVKIISDFNNRCLNENNIAMAIQSLNLKLPIVHVIFDKKQKAITPGQSVVFYLKGIDSRPTKFTSNICIGGGIIENVFSEV